MKIRPLIRAATFFAFSYAVYIARLKPCLDNKCRPQLTTEIGWPVLTRLLVETGNFLGNLLFGADYLMTEQTGYYVLYLVILLNALLFLMPNIPLFVSLSSVISLYVVLTKTSSCHLMTTMSGQECLTWTVSWMSLLCSMFLLSVFKRSLFNYIYLFFLSLLIGFLPLLRQECEGIPYLMSIAVLFIVLIIIGVTYFSRIESSDRQTYIKKAAGVALAFLILLVVLIAEKEIFRYSYAELYDLDYSTMAAPEHGRGTSLYMGLGYVANPYNIVWEDYVGSLHNALYKPEIICNNNLFDDPICQKFWSDQWLKIVMEDPGLLIRNAVAKAGYLHIFLLKQKIDETNRKNFGVGTGASFLFKIIYIYFWIFLCIFLAVVFYFKKEVDYLILFGGFTGVALGSIIGALTAYPAYPAGAYGVIISSFFVITPGLWLFPMEGPNGAPDSERGRGLYDRTRRLLLTLFAVAVLGILLFVFIQDFRMNRAVSKITKGDPFAAISQKEYKYAHLFNRLPVDEQIKVIQRLTTAQNENVVVGKDFESGDAHIFNPAMLIFSGAQMHLIAYLGEGFEKPFIEIDQGHASSIVSINSAPQGHNLQFAHTFINDLEWRGRYKMFSFPLYPVLKNEKYIRVSADQAVASEDFTVTSRNISSTVFEKYR